jgi:kinesin family protein 6/9
MEEDPDKFKAAQEALKKEKEEKKEASPPEQPPAKGGKADPKADKKAAAAQPVEEKKEEPVKEEVVEKEPETPVKHKRQAIDKQTAFLEFKGAAGKKIEDTILLYRKDVKDKRLVTKDLTEKINIGKRLIDKLKSKLDKKEDERKADMKHKDLEFEDEEAVNEEIIDEEELMMLKDMKELKREYRDNFNTLKGYKSELKSLADNIDVSKEQLIYQFENWYTEEFELSQG